MDASADQSSTWAGVSGSVKLTGEPVARLFRALECTGCQAEQHGVVWWFQGGLRLYLADRPAMPQLPFELSVVPSREEPA